MKKLNIGAGGDIKPGWENYDIMFDPPYRLDIREPLPFEDDSVDFIYSSHTIEHVTGPEAFWFLKECYRVLKKDGVIRICVPSISRVYQSGHDEYYQWVVKQGFAKEPTRRAAIENLIVNHGHQTVWSVSSLEAFVHAAGFIADECKLQDSSFKELKNIENHWKVIGEENNWVESIVVEGYKK